ncbi:retrotransposon-like protein 1 [Entomophthora muscae]|uniref:Retrotransposon-like protein 1 n=1 Tax=Entomophthora muscae TaxID=34485 RepID=A0ACC2SW08_9FUNG|nr:retrotransposon-like protein 1 [Entomophthora muscae]
MVLVDTGAAGNFMDLALAQSLGLPLLPPQSLIATSKVLALSYSLTNPLSYCTGSHVFVSKFSAVEDLLYPVIVGVGWWQRHLVKIDCLTKELHFLLDRSLGYFPLLPSGWEPPESCLSLAATPVSPPEPFALPAILALFEDAFDATLFCALPPHSCHNLTFKTMVDLTKIDTQCTLLVNWRTRRWARGCTTCWQKGG